MKHLVRFFAFSMILLFFGSVLISRESHAIGGSPLVRGPNVNVSQRQGNESEATIAINPTNENNLVALSNIAGGNGLFKAFSTDAGLTWTTDIIADGDALGTACCDASVAGCFDTFGNLFLTYLITAPPRQVQTALSTDGGQTFTPLAQIATGNVDQPTITEGAGAVWVSYRDNANSISARGATVTGLGVVGAFNAAQVAPGSGGGTFGDIAIGPAGQVMVTYQRTTTCTDNNGDGDATDPGECEGPANVFVNVDPDGIGGAGFGAVATATTTNVGAFDYLPAQSGRSVDSEPGLAYDRSGGPRNGRAYLVYTDEAVDENNDMNIFVRFSTDNGATWSPRVRANDDAGTNSQFLPRIALDQTTGDIAVSWHDSRNDTGGGAGDTNGIANDDAQFFATVSTDGAANFQLNLQVSAGTSNDNAAANGIDYGDYTGLTFHNGAFYPIWADNSNSTGDNPNGALSRFDIYTARVTCCTITCPASITVPSDPGQCAAIVTFSPTTTGNCGTVTCTPASGGSFPVGTTTVTCSTTSGPSCSFTVTVQDTEPPTITCPAPISRCNDPDQCGAVVTFATTAADNCPGVTTSCLPASGSFFPVGTTTVACTATDAAGNTSGCSFNVTVNDCQAPSVTCSVAQTSLWPSNHNLINAGLASVATDNCPGPLTIQVMVFGDEDDEGATGDGNHSPDAKNIGLQSLRLRSERKGDGDGRVYLIVVKATDAAGNVGFCCSTVIVAHDQSAASVASVQAQAVAAQAFCGANGGAPPPGFFVIGDGAIMGPKQ
jgi:hypothetical protein